MAATFRKGATNVNSNRIRSLQKLNLMGIPISKSSYAKIETNRMNIKVSELVALAKILDCEVGDFFKDLK